MKVEQIAILVFLIFLIILTVTTVYKEQFVSGDCNNNTDCKSCANQSGCSWCPAKKICMQSNSLKSTDTECNQMNTIQSSFSCTNRTTNALSDENLYKDHIQDRPKPPNVFTTPNMEYSNETVMGELSHLKGELKGFQYALPGIVTNTMKNNIQPLIMSQLLPNYEPCN
jgi:hypothetical protein